MNKKSRWGIAGMGVMGTSLSRNFAQKGIQLALYNRRVKGLEEDVALKKKNLFSELQTAEVFEELIGFVSALEAPRKILLMLPAGKPTDQFLAQLVPLLSKGDIIMDGGNTHYQETEKRSKTLQEKGILFLGIGVSGGEEGALNGPSLMVGGDPEAYEIVKNDLFQIAAQNKTNKPCCAFFGTGGAGHFVKMVHNGIEYAEMQLLAEVYALIRSNTSYDDIQNTLIQWNKTKSKGYLLEITAALLHHKEGQLPFIDLIQDQASSKGTGAWATATGTTLGYSNSLMASALHARYISSFKKARVAFSNEFNEEHTPLESTLIQLKKSYDLSRWINHHQGFEMLAIAAKEYNWNLDLSQVASVWSEGCIIKSDLMELCASLFKNESSLLYSKEFKLLLMEGKAAWKNTLKSAIESEISIHCIQSAWSYFTALKTDKSSANIIQAQRDYFGAHGFLKVDSQSDVLQHGPWSKKESSQQDQQGDSQCL